MEVRNSVKFLVDYLYRYSNKAWNVSAQQYVKSTHFPAESD